ncbi:type II secretion system protein [Massilia sp. H6]|uniref:type II secretion system protein n=1 Tax=Massilia sp. H6 TaxID=2970464 RepID=UPI002167603F|nr:type II secretion system protein [Massilia sp. H6]UVW28586.1 type II secretion system GspH family protein [Massilia sp. H6]
MKVATLGRASGFTMVELVMVMVLIGVIAAIGVPRMMGNNTMAAAAFGDQVVSALRTAQKSAVARRRLVCASVGASAVTLTMSPSSTRRNCTEPLNAETYSTSASGVTAAASPSTLYFQPNGMITSDADGRTPVSGTVVIQSDTSRTITFEGSTGHVQVVP